MKLSAESVKIFFNIGIMDVCAPVSALILKGQKYYKSITAKSSYRKP